jgi:hypothetical protein
MAQIGQLTDFNGRPVTVGTDYDAVTINDLVFDPEQVPELLDLIVRAALAAGAPVNG